MSHFAIDLGHGRVTLVDEADRQLVAGFTWWYCPRGYVRTDRGNMHIYLHRLIAGAGPTDVVDHINGDGLDNRSANLRRCTQSQNAANAGPNRRVGGKSSRFKGVSWNTSKQRWRAYVHYQGKTRSVGTFTDETEAARAYDNAATEIWGEFARLNLAEGG